MACLPLTVVRCTQGSRGPPPPQIPPPGQALHGPVCTPPSTLPAEDKGSSCQRAVEEHAIDLWFLWANAPAA